MTDGIIQKKFNELREYYKDIKAYSKLDIYFLELELIAEIKNNKDSWYEGISLQKLIGDNQE